MAASEDSVTFWLNELCEGHRSSAATALWERYFQRLVRFARRKLEQQGANRRAVDEEDVALSAFKSFCARAERGCFPDLADRDGLWRLLLTMTYRKAIDLGRYNRARPVVEAPAGSAADSSPPGMEQLVGETPTPEFVAILTEEFEERLKGLSPELLAIALAKLEGYSHEEIASQLGCSVPTVNRRVRRIRELWEGPRR